MAREECCQRDRALGFGDDAEAEAGALGGEAGAGVGEVVQRAARARAALGGAADVAPERAADAVGELLDHPVEAGPGRARALAGVGEDAFEDRAHLLDVVDAPEDAEGIPAGIAHRALPAGDVVRRVAEAGQPAGEGEEDPVVGLRGGGVLLEQALGLLERAAGGDEGARGDEVAVVEVEEVAEDGVHRGRAHRRLGAEAEALVADRVFERLRRADAEAEHPAVHDGVGPVVVAPEGDARDRRRAGRGPAAPVAPPGVEDEEALGRVAEDDEGVAFVAEGAAGLAGAGGDDHAAGGTHAVVAPAVVELGRDDEGAGLVQRGVAGVEVGAQAVVGAEREALRVARPLDAELARVAAGGVGPEPVAADAVVVEALDDVAERDAVRGAAVALQPGAFVDHPRAGRVGLDDLRGDALQVDEGGEGLAAAGALLALRAGQDPGARGVAQRVEDQGIGVEVRREGREGRLVGAVADVDGVADDAADGGLVGRRGRAAAPGLPAIVGHG